MTTIPKKIRAALALYNITGVVDGYITKMPADTLLERAQGITYTAFTGWSVDGEVVCVLVKKRKKDWTPVKS